MAVQLSEDQFRELMRTAQPQPRNRHFTQCTARFDGTRTQAAVTEFLTAIKIFKSVERIADADALTGEPEPRPRSRNFLPQSRSSNPSKGSQTPTPSPVYRSYSPARPVRGGMA
ncbi:hypothetical protein QE152_g27442 [Popillia japonica]|uniref:Uncharacterized protein n=1 Tax=Popillia japonica TaxID=7064 RepID=A0AAW1JVA4_POPJA